MGFRLIESLFTLTTRRMVKLWQDAGKNKVPITCLGSGGRKVHRRRWIDKYSNLCFLRMLTALMPHLKLKRLPSPGKLILSENWQIEYR